jgi:hypothetical protein
MAESPPRVYANGQSVDDPTANVRHDLDAAVKRQDDLRSLEAEGLKDLIRSQDVLHDEKMASVETQFQLIERQRVEQKADTEKAVQAALSAAKEAVKEQTAASEKSITKSETATAEQLRQLTATFTTAIGGVTDTIGDLKDRVGKIESRKEGSGELSRSLIAIGGLILTMLLVLSSLAIATHGFTK